MVCFFSNTALPLSTHGIFAVALAQSSKFFCIGDMQGRVTVCDTTLQPRSVEDLERQLQRRVEDNIIHRKRETVSRPGPVIKTRASWLAHTQGTLIIIS